MVNEGLKNYLVEGQAAFSRHEYAVASQAFEQAATADPRNTVAWKGLGFALTAQQRAEDAVEALTKATQLDQQDADTHYGLALAFQHLGDDTRVIRELETCLALREDHPAARPLLKQTLKRQAEKAQLLGNVEWAERHLRRLFEVDKKCPESYLELVKFYHGQARHAEAIAWFQKLEDLAPSFPSLGDWAVKLGLAKQKQMGWY